jgi:hypothetical protein
MGQISEKITDGKNWKRNLLLMGMKMTLRRGSLA